MQYAACLSRTAQSKRLWRAYMDRRRNERLSCGSERALSHADAVPYGGAGRIRDPVVLGPDPYDDLPGILRFQPFAAAPQPRRDCIVCLAGTGPAYAAS